MEVRNVPIGSAHRLTGIAGELGINVTAEIRRNGYRVRLYPGGEGADRERFRAWSPSGRKVNGICWHGHYAYLGRLMLEFPRATVKSAVATYRGLEDFRALARETGERVVGPMAQPMLAREACRCASDPARGADWSTYLDIFDAVTDTATV
jgi:hypothetical protein